jgi:hypothetical protein
MIVHSSLVNDLTGSILCDEIVLSTGSRGHLLTSVEVKPATNRSECAYASHFRRVPSFHRSHNFTCRPKRHVCQVTSSHCHVFELHVFAPSFNLCKEQRRRAQKQMAVLSHRWRLRRLLGSPHADLPSSTLITP